MSNLDFGLNILVGIKGQTLLESERALLKKLRPIGIILFSENIGDGPDWKAELAALISESKSLTGRGELLVSIDHEGGRVHRFKQDVTRFPAAASWQDKTAEVAEAMALELRALGFNLSFAPVLDVNAEEKNQVIGTRSFSSNPESVAKRGETFINALEGAGVLACGKHFPGHGATVEDSHFRLPSLDLSKEELAARELIPFRHAIKKDLHLLMTAHVMYPKLDAIYPATLSRKIIGELLRDELGYKGVVISDDLEMKALDNFSHGEKAALALAAGVDILLIGKSENEAPLKIAAEMKQGLESALASKILDQGTIEMSQERVKNLIEHSRSLDNSAKESSVDLIGCSKHVAICKSLE